MKNSEVIQLIKQHHYHDWLGKEIDEQTTRDQVLFGTLEKPCSGVVTAIYASIEVIEETIKLGANLIICHESLFWNHGDHTEWLIEDKTYQEKKALLQQHHITVWRAHDYLHAGIDYEGKRIDVIFYGLLTLLGWENIIKGPVELPILLELSNIKTRELIHTMINKLGLNGVKCFGNIDGFSKNLYIPHHIDGKDHEKIKTIEREDIDTIISMECIDYTVGIYVRDSAMLHRNRCILSIGHFNLEEPGMKWYGEVYLPMILPKNLPVNFVKTGDMYQFVVKEENQ